MTLQRRIGDTRRWIGDHPHHAITAWPIRPSRTALLHRQAEVDTILAGAPPDQRQTIDRLRAGQLSLDDTKQLLDTATTGQTERQQWIIANWPHIIEANLIDTAINTGNYGPDINTLATSIQQTTTSPALFAAAGEQEPWLAAALNQTSVPQDIDVSNRALDWLENIADHRQANGITSRDPLGPLPHQPEQRNRWNDLANQGDNLHSAAAIEIAQPTFAESPNDYLRNELERVNQPGNNRQGPDLGIWR